MAKETAKAKTAKAKTTKAKAKTKIVKAKKATAKKVKGDPLDQKFAQFLARGANGGGYKPTIIIGAKKPIAPTAPISTPDVSTVPIAHDGNNDGLNLDLSRKYTFAFVTGQKAVNPIVTINGKSHKFTKEKEQIEVSLLAFDNLPFKARRPLAYAFQKFESLGLKSLQLSVAGGYANRLQLGITKQGDSWREFVAFQDNTLYFKDTAYNFSISDLVAYAEEIGCSFHRKAAHWCGWKVGKNAVFPDEEAWRQVIDYAFVLNHLAG